jgi:hypothetical protein
MVTLLTRLMLVLRASFESRARLEAENLVLRRQLLVLNRRLSRRLRLRNLDRLIFVWLYRQFPSLLDAIIIVKPERVFGTSSPVRPEHRSIVTPSGP